MAILKDLIIPHMGSVENAKLLEWHISEGDSFREGDSLFSVETDKTASEIEAPDAGILVRQLAKAGDEFKVGARIGLWTTPGTPATDIKAALAGLDDCNTAPSPPSSSQPAPGAPAILPSQEASARLSPLVRRLAAEHGVDVAGVTGTGPGGRITGDDILAAAGGGADPQRILHSLRRKTIARRMAEAAAIPTLTADMEIDLSGLFARRRQDGEKPATSVLGELAHAAVACLREHPALNAHFSSEATLLWSAVHLGVAVDVPDGLVVPVIRNAERLTAGELTRAIADLAGKARDGRLAPQELEGGTFTLSNPGSLGPVIRAEALLNPPQVALLGLAGIVQVPKAVPDGGGFAVEVRPVLRASLSFDHRALDGGPIIAFLSAFKDRVETA